MRMLVDFADELRDAGLAVGSGDVLTYCKAMEPLDPTDLVHLYWAGRTTTVTRRDQIPVFDRVFRRRWCRWAYRCRLTFREMQRAPGSACRQTG